MFRAQHKGKQLEILIRYRCSAQQGYISSKIVHFKPVLVSGFAILVPAQHAYERQRGQHTRVFD